MQNKELYFIIFFIFAFLSQNYSKYEKNLSFSFLKKTQKITHKTSNYAFSTQRYQNLS